MIKNSYIEKRFFVFLNIEYFSSKVKNWERDNIKLSKDNIVWCCFFSCGKRMLIFYF